MRCYNHQDVDANGLCKSCHKGICSDCSTLVGGSVACSETCQEDVAALNYLVERGKKVYKNLGRQWTPAAFINSIGGTLFVGYGLYNFGRLSSWLFIGLGAIMIVGGILSIIQGKQMGETKN